MVFHSGFIALLFPILLPFIFSPYSGELTRGRNIFRSPFQTRFDLSVFKEFRLSERFKLRWDTQAFNLFNHPSFDAPNNDIRFNPFFQNPPLNINNFTTGYTIPPRGFGGIVQHTIGSPRFLQMALHLTF
jgi:hypothetical protein